MAKYVSLLSSDVCEALRTLGVEPNDCERIIIVFEVDEPIKVYTEQIATAPADDVINAIVSVHPADVQVIKTANLAGTVPAAPDVSGADPSAAARIAALPDFGITADRRCEMFHRGERCIRDAGHVGGCQWHVFID